MLGCLPTFFRMAISAPKFAISWGGAGSAQRNRLPLHSSLYTKLIGFWIEEEVLSVQIGEPWFRLALGLPLSFLTAISVYPAFPWIPRASAENTSPKAPPPMLSISLILARGNSYWSTLPSWDKTTVWLVYYANVWTNLRRFPFRCRGRNALPAAWYCWNNYGIKINYFSLSLFKAEQMGEEFRVWFSAITFVSFSVSSTIEPTIFFFPHTYLWLMLVCVLLRRMDVGFLSISLMTILFLRKM